MKNTSCSAFSVVIAGDTYPLPVNVYCVKEAMTLFRVQMYFQSQFCHPPRCQNYLSTEKPCYNCCKKSTVSFSPHFQPIDGTNIVSRQQFATSITSSIITLCHLYSGYSKASNSSFNKIAFLEIAWPSVIWNKAIRRKFIPWTFIEPKTVGISWKTQSKHWPSWAEGKNQGTVENNMLCRGKGIHRNGHHCWLRGKKRFRKA